MRTNLVRQSILPVLLLSAAGLSHAGIAYTVVVDTSSVNGTTGFLDFQFAPGFDSQSAFAAVTNFTPSGNLLGNLVATGTLTGTPGATLTLHNDGLGAEDSDFFTYGASLSFRVTIDGPAVTAPDNTSGSGSTFSFGMLDNGFTPILTSDPNGFAFQLDLGLTGAVTPANSSVQTTLTPVVSGTPEPGALSLSALGLLSLALVSRRHRAT